VICAGILARGGRGAEAIAEVRAAIGIAVPHLESSHPSLIAARARLARVLLWGGDAPTALLEAERQWPDCMTGGTNPRNTLLDTGLKAASMLRDTDATDRWAARCVEVRQDWHDHIMRSRWESVNRPASTWGPITVEHAVNAVYDIDDLLRRGDLELADRLMRHTRAKDLHPTTPLWMHARLDWSFARLQDALGEPEAAARLRRRAQMRLQDAPAPDWMVPLSRQEAAADQAD